MDLANLAPITRSGPSAPPVDVVTVWRVVGRWVTFRPSMDQKGYSNLIHNLEGIIVVTFVGGHDNDPSTCQVEKEVGGDESRGWCRRRLGMVRSSFY